MNKLTTDQITELITHCHDQWHTKLKNYKPIQTLAVRECELAYSDHAVTVVYYDCLPREYIAKLQAQLSLAESRGYKSTKPLLLFLFQFTSDDNMGGGMMPAGDTSDGRLAAYMGISMNTNSNGTRNPILEQRALEHEYWHLVDYAGNHSGLWSDHDDLINPTDTREALFQHIVQDMGRGSLSSGTLIRALKGVEIEQFKQYSDQPHELWVHHRMCETAGVEPRSIEGYHRSHNIMHNVISYLNVMPGLGVSRSTCRKAAQQFALEITQDRKGFMEEMTLSGYGWLFR